MPRGRFKIHERIRLRNPDFGRDTQFGNPEARVIETTVGRVFFNEVWPPEMGLSTRRSTRAFLGI
jgi:DNA-directed RNA polymerase subunit beta'